MSLLQNSNAISAGGYDINNSLRFRGSASAYLSRTPASNGDRQKWTFSAWVKRGASGVRQGIFVANPSGAVYWGLEFDASNCINIYDSNAGGTTALTTTQVFRDFGAWYHVVVAIDTTQSTASNRVKLYINGTQVTAFSVANYPSQNSNTQINTGSLAHYIGNWNPSVANLPLDGYMAEVNFIDGSQKAASDFGETDSTTGVWKPKAYSGTYGTNGFYLKFSDIATTSGSNAGLGKDFSGNSNYFNTNNISVTAGTTYDAMTDVPTNTSATVANYCTLNPLRNTAASNGTFSNANLRVTGVNGATNCYAAGTMSLSGKMYWEVTVTTIATASTAGVGVVLNSSNQIATAGTMTTGIYYLGNGDKRVTGTSSAYGSSYTSGDVIGIAVDTSAETVTFYKNNTSQGSISGTGVISLGVLPYIGMDDVNSPSITANFGQRPFTYTPPTGFVSVNTYNLSTPTILQGNKYMDATLYTGTGTALNVANAGQFKPDFVWAKNRSAADSSGLYDSVRGVNQRLISNLTNAEDTSSGVSAFNSNGFSLGTAANYNTSGNNFVGWQWQAGQGSTTTGTGTGGITSVTQSVNTTAGFSIVIYTGSGTTGTVTHGLGVAPRMIIIKNRGVGTAGNGEWQVYHASLGNTQYLALNTTAAAATATNRWNNTSPTSSVFTVATTGSVNDPSNTYVAYCWAEIAGFSKFGSYTGNGSTDGPFVYTGFRPKYVLIKNTTTTGQIWFAYDTSRSPYNLDTAYLAPNSSNAEAGSSVDNPLDILSNGFKIRYNNTGTNTNGNTYIYAAFAENPFKNSNAR